MKKGSFSISWRLVVALALGLGLLGAYGVSRGAEEGTTTKTPSTTSPKATQEQTKPTTKYKIVGSSMLIGRALYAYEEMGGSGKSCKTCHKQGQDSEGHPWKKKKEDTYLDGKMSLVKAINYCITNHQGGAALAANGAEMKSLLGYVSSLQK